jgi:alginate O-acetyltransferase complex protein AlgI
VLLLGYSVQIFADFAGYSLIAIGLGAAFGYVLPENFREPYLSRSLREFWTRWHISLSTWLRDYLYIPLGGNRRGAAFTLLNLLFVMTVGGFWHGAAWSYGLWGFFHGLGLVIERSFARVLSRNTVVSHSIVNCWLIAFLQWLIVFIFVSIGWVFFRLTDYREAISFLKSILFWHYAPKWMVIVPVLLFSAPVILYHARRIPLFQTTFARLFWGRGVSTALVNAFVYGILLVLIFLNKGNSTTFIYFQF